MSTRALAKLTRPRLFDAVERPRLLSLLDEAAKRPIVWIAAPPGAGKTTLVASYLEARSLRHIWYQVDSGDADPATFVHYMRDAARQVVRRKTALPLFPPEAQQDPARFARSFFRDLFDALPRPCALVLDNFQEARAAPEHRSALAQGLEETPDGITVFIVSRTDPSAEFSRLLANRLIGRIEEAALRCEPEEADAILGGQVSDANVVRRILRQSDGWVAALVLLREHFNRTGASLDESLGEGKEAVFQYFAGEIFNRARPENQRMLMVTALAPSITEAEAVALTGNVEASRLLEYLYRRHLFIDRRRGAQTTYQYHALFREYLRNEMAGRLPPAERQAALKQAAALLAARGQDADALELYREAGEWDAMRNLVARNALDWARQGRAQVLSDWIEALPESMRTTDPWLDYWYGRAWIFLQPARGHPALERAFEAFRAGGDLRGQALALSTIVTGYYYEWDDIRAMDRWLPEFDRILAEATAAALDRESELRVRAAQLIAVLFRRPDEELLRRNAERLDAMIDAEPDVTVRVMAASILLNTYNWTTGGEAAAGLVGRIEPVVAAGEVSPLMQVWWRTHVSFWHYIGGRYDASTAVGDRAREIAEHYGLEVILFEIDFSRAGALISKGEHEAAKSLIEEMELRLVPTRRMDQAYLHYLRSLLAQLTGRFDEAVHEAERGVALGEAIGLPVPQVPQFLMRLAHSRGTAGDRAGAAAAMDRAISLATDADRINFEQQRELLQIDDDIHAGRAGHAKERLAAVLADYRRMGHAVLLRSRPDAAARLADFALQNSIEPEYVLTLIRRSHLAPPPEPSDAWPFRVRVRVLGRFELRRDGQAMRFTGKLQQRPLDLLKLVVAAGGREVDSQQVMAALWPDANGAAAKSSFDATLFRLRKLLDVEHAIVLSGGKLSLSAALVWTDMWAFDAVVESTRRALEADDGMVSDAAMRLIKAYPGALLGDEEEVWLAQPRDAARARFTRTLGLAGERLEQRGEWADAAELYRRGLEADNLAETFHRGLMRSLAVQGERAEALNAYRRCRDLLSIVLGVKPAAETEQLHRRIVAGEPLQIAP